MQRSGPVDLCGIGVGAGMEEDANASLITLLGGVGERCRESKT